MPNPTQLTVDGREMPLQAPQPTESRAAAPVPLFDAPQTMRGQLNLPTDQRMCEEVARTERTRDR